jgi:hypothetical protein
MMFLGRSAGALALLVFCSACGGGESDPNAKFGTLEEMLASPRVQQAIARLPAGDGVVAGDYYRGSAPVDVTGTWSTDNSGGATGKWSAGAKFGGTVTFQVTAPGKVDLLAGSSQLDTSDGRGSFVVGTGQKVTLFIQLAVTCTGDGEKVRVATVDRLVHTGSALAQYVRSYIVLAREKESGWACFSDAVGTGSTSSEATYAR